MTHSYINLTPKIAAELTVPLVGNRADLLLGAVSTGAPESDL